LLFQAQCNCTLGNALVRRKDVLKVVYFPKGSSEFNTAEKCCRQGNYNLVVSKYYPRFTELKKSLTEY
jgi:hypothetical protein